MRRRDAIAELGGGMMGAMIGQVLRPILVAVAMLSGARYAAAQEGPVSISVYGGACSVLMVAGAPSAKPCIGTLMVNGFADGRKAVIFHNADDEAIAFQATLLRGEHFSVTSVEVNGQASPATGTCTLHLDARNTGDIRCEAISNGQVTSGTFAVSALNHSIGVPQ